jgi:hypothetical protein
MGSRYESPLVEVRDEVLVIDRPPSSLDELVLDVTEILDGLDIEYAVISGYVAVLLGRARAKRTLTSSRNGSRKRRRTN